MDKPEPNLDHTTVQGIGTDLAPDDPLGEALHFLRMSGIFYSRCLLTEPWCVKIPTFPGCLMYHAVVSGHCWVEVEGAEPVRVEAGELVLVTHGKGHNLMSEAGVRTPKLFDLPIDRISDRQEVIRHGRGGAETKLICCTVRYAHPSAYQLISLLPPIITVRSDSPDRDMVDSVIRLLGSETRDATPGSETVVTRLADLLLIQTIRSWIEQNDATNNCWLGALKDKQLSQALVLIHKDPAHPWTVSSLASEVATSRAGFAARFKTVVGEPPIQYITRGKMHLAMTWLKEEDTPLSDLSLRLGYQSEAAFSHAFKRFMGVTPGSVRRQGEWAFID